MDEIELSIRAAWEKIQPRLSANPAEFRRRLDRRRSLSSPPRAWCLAVRASDMRLDRYCCDVPDVQSPNQILLDVASLRKLCLPVMLTPPGEPLADVAAKLGVSPGGLLNARVKGLFQTHHLPILDGHAGKPHPMLYTSEPLDPATRGFVCPDPIWSWTGTYLPCRLPDDLPDQLLTRIAHFRERGQQFHRDSSELHPEHPLVDQTLSLSKGRSLKLPPPEPDPVWYKWKGDFYMGYDWRNPRSAANYLRAEQRKTKSRAAQKARRLAKGPALSLSKDSLQFRGWRWQCPQCNRAVNVLFLPVPPINLIAARGLSVVGGQSSAGKNHPLTLSPPHLATFSQSLQGFACKHCHRVRYTDGCKKGAWGQIVAYLSGGLLYGNEVPRPAYFVPIRKSRYSPRLSREPSIRRPQIEKLLLAGKAIRQIAHELNLSQGTILFYCKQIYPQHGVKCLRDLLLKYDIPLRPGMRGPARGKRGEGRVPRPKHPRITARQQIRERILAGESPNDIASALELSRHVVLEHLSKLRRCGRIPVNLRLKKRGITRAVRNEIRRRIREGETTARIVKALGVTVRAVYNQRWVMKKRNETKQTRGAAHAPLTTAAHN